MPSSLPVFTRVSPDVAVGRVGGTLDYRNAHAFVAAAQSPAARGALHFVLDFEKTGHVDSRGLAAVFSLFRAVSARGGTVSFARPSVAVSRVVQITRVYRVFRQFPTLDAAVAAALAAGERPVPAPAAIA